ncbi:acyl carrier protein [Anaerotignum propionicum]|uniref:Acyl carrier protein n=1 Tax=Anaerotignum propionicum DSM 1682 TaxID=991789 RepID=A0A0X8VBL8_ANAPI|nr:acyl carrier protein [Anaerotignum propionicum]AMJ41938.1 acyl carrier protein [Anaerotignum propionicum DSM 1682]MEA5057818.1 acyl carrier protein [Anaerotignum propionicum]SHE94536.1 acyl carrier protein [[Clostridium] propionicum DSM 1682] [Anaerotignum propionicum DSM 1682]
MDESVVMNVIAEQMNISVDTLTPDTVFADLGADSLDLFQIISALEEAFDMEFENDEAEKIKTIGDAIAYIKNVLEN